MVSHLLMQRALRTKLLTMTGLPTARAWENINYTPTIGTAWVKETYLPGPMFRETVGSSAQLEVRPTYIVEFYSGENIGMDALSLLADTCLELFAPGTEMTAGSDVLRVRGDTAPYRGQVLTGGDGFASVAVTIPCRIRTTNSI